MLFEIDRATKKARIPGIRVTEEERARFDREARRRGLAASDLVRLALKVVLLVGDGTKKV
jgi:hypothetical protein